MILSKLHISMLGFCSCLASSWSVEQWRHSNFDDFEIQGFPGPFFMDIL